MALVLSGGLVVSSGTQQPQVDTLGNLATCVAATFQGENQPSILTLAKRGIRRGVRWVNLKVKLRCGSKQSADTALVAGTSTIALAADFFAIDQVQLINSDSQPSVTLDYIPWNQFNSLVESQTETGVPRYWTSRNSFDDNTIQVYPVPDASAAADYTSRVSYYERVNEPTADSDIVDAPNELGEVLCTYGEAYVAFARDKDNVAAWSSKKREAERLLGDFMRSMDIEHGDTLQFRIHYEQPRLTGQIDPLR